VDLVQLVEDLKRSVEDRRRAGLYPPGLEEQLDEHARQFAGHRVARRDPIPHLRAAIEEVAQKRDIHRNAIPPTSSVPLGSVVHRTAERLQRRHLEDLATQMEAFAATVTGALRIALEVLERPQQDSQMLLEQLDAVLERIRALEAGAPLGGPLGSMIERVERLEAAGRQRHFDPFFSNERFEAAFRGSQDALRVAYADLADRLTGHPPVIEIGCGQGAVLELLAERNVPATGVELDGELARLCQSKGLPVEERDGLDYLQVQVDGSVGAIVLLQVIEHLSHQQVADLFLLAHQKLRPGGLLAIETVNPQSLYVYARAFFLDPTHSTPVHPSYLEFLALEAGFSGYSIDWRNPVPPDEALTSDTEDARRLNALIFGPQDYLFLGVR